MKRRKVYLDRLTKLAEWLEAGAPHKHVRFDMDRWLGLEDADGLETNHIEDACGSVCCISGAAVQFFAPKVAKEIVKPNSMHDMVREGAKVLGLTRNEAFDLFLGQDIDITRVTPQQAGAVVRHLLETGVVDWWSVVRP